MPPDLRTKLGHVELPNPVLTASGCAGAGRELSRFTDVARLGAVVTKSIMLAPRSGRPTPRMAETPSGMLNSIGLQGPGIDAFLQRDLPWLLSQGARAVVSIAGGSVAEYAELARRLSAAPGITAIEVNISCPNVEDRGQVFACNAVAAAEVIRAVKRETRTPVFAKLSPDVTDIVSIAHSVVEAGANGLFFTVSKYEPRIVYKFQADAPVSAGIGSHGDIAYVPSEDYRVYALDIVTAKILWRFLGGGPIVSQRWARDVLKRTCRVEPVWLYGSSSALIGRSPRNCRVMAVVMRWHAMSASS